MRSIPPRALALFLGLFCLVNLTGGWLRPGFDANIWWIDTRMLPAWLANLLLACAAVVLSMYALKPHAGRLRRRVACLCVIALGCVVLDNCTAFYRLRALGEINAAIPVPLSIMILLALGLILWSMCRPAVPDRRWHLTVTGVVAVATAITFALAQMVFFGKTDYRAPADVAVVFGAKVYADGSASQALADRVATACDLYHQGLVSKLIFSGGPGAGTVTEPQGMQRLAVSLGVPRHAILLDPQGLNTDATVAHTAPLLDQIGARRVLAVSHFYHLPRIKMAYQRRGIEVRTVPARETYLLTAMPYYMAREVAAMWVYYLRPLVT